MAQGLKLSNGSNISGFSSPVQPDRGFTRETTPNVIRAVFGDGYEQRKVLGINNNKEVFVLIQRAINWLNTNSYSTKIVKWETKKWGEIPADFGRK